MKKILIILMTVIFFISIMGIGIGCKEEAVEEEAVEEEAVEEEAVEEEAVGPISGGTLTVAFSGEFANLDPHIGAATIDRLLADMVHQYLWRQNKDRSDYDAMLAEEWNWEDAYTLAIKVREGVFFTNDREVEAKDVEFTLNRILNPDTGSPRAGLYEPITEIEVVDKYNLKLHFDKYYPSIINLLCRESIIPEETVPTIKTEPFGCGPWIFDRWDKGSKIVFKKNPNYWREGLPYTDELVIRFMPEYSSAKAALLTGEIDIIDWADATDYESLISIEGIKINTETPTINVATYISFNTSRDILNNSKFRRAVSLAIDTAEMNEVGRHSLTPLLAAPMPAGDIYYDPAWEALRERNIEEAKRLLAEAFPDGLDRKLEISTNLGSADETAMGEVLQAQLKEIGIETDLVSLEIAAVIDKWITKGDFDIAILGDFFDVNNPDFWIRKYYFPEGDLAILNGYWENEQVMKLADEAMDPNIPLDEKKAIYSSLFEIVLKESPMITISNSLKIQAMAENVMGYIQFGTENSNYEEVWKALEQ